MRELADIEHKIMNNNRELADIEHKIMNNNSVQENWLI